MDLSIIPHKADLPAILTAEGAACDSDAWFDDGPRSSGDAVAIGQLVDAHIRTLRKLCGLWSAFENDGDQLGAAHAGRSFSGATVQPDGQRGIAH